MTPIIWEDMKEIFGRRTKWEELYGKRVLVTGAYGMLASYSVFMLIFINETVPSANIEIFALGRSRTRAEKRFGEYFHRPYFHFINIDLSDLENQDFGFDYAIHAASPASSQYYSIDPISVITPNVFGTNQLLRRAKRLNAKSVLYISSGEVYGKIYSETVREDEYGTSDPLDIRYCYGESKRMGECLCKCYEHQYGVPTKIVRLGHTYGPTLDIVNDKRVYAEFTRNIVNSEDIQIKSSGRPMRAFCYAADAVAAFYLVLLHGKSGEAYNVANRNAFTSISELANVLVSLFPEKNLSVQYGSREPDENYIESPQERHSIPSTEKIEALGWQCKYGIRDGFYRTVKSIECENKRIIKSGNISF